MILFQCPLVVSHVGFPAPLRKSSHDGEIFTQKGYEEERGKFNSIILRDNFRVSFVKSLLWFPYNQSFTLLWSRSKAQNSQILRDTLFFSSIKSYHFCSFSLSFQRFTDFDRYSSVFILFYFNFGVSSFGVLILVSNSQVVVRFCFEIVKFDMIRSQFVLF